MKLNFVLSPILFFLAACGGDKKDSPQNKTGAVISSIVVPNISKEEIKKYHDIVDSFLQNNLLRGSFNGSILIAKEGVPVYERYVGYKNKQTKDTLTQNSSLQIASTSKPFTAAAILRLAEQGKLKLDDPLQVFFPGFPYPDVTIKTLLNHRSGLPNYLYYMEKGGWDRKLLATNGDILNTLMTWQPPKAYRANTAFNYCNTNYVLLALVVEKLSGQTFPEFMRTQFFKPYGMNHTYVLTATDTALRTPSFDGYGAEWAMDFSDGPYGDKNVYSTPRDLLKWDQAWYNGSVVGQALADSAMVGYSNEKPGTHNYGLGWRLLLLPNGKKVVYHNGKWHGFNSAFTRLTDEKITIIILTNRYNRNVYSVARKMYDLFGNYTGTDKGEE